MPTVTFHGACGVVTGSSTHLDWGERKVLVDCGMYQGGEELELRNRQPFAYRPSELTAVVVTHAHLDHTGLLPRLVAEGYGADLLHEAEPGTDLARSPGRWRAARGGGPLRAPEGIQPACRAPAAVHRRGRPADAEAAAADAVRRGKGAF